MRLSFGSTIFDSLGTDSTVLGTAMSTLYLLLDSGSPLADRPEPVVVSEDEDAITFRFFLVYTAANIGTLNTNVDLIVRALTDPPGTTVTLESVSGTTLRTWTQANQQYMAATGAVNVHYGSATTAMLECVVSLSKTPYRGAGVSSTPLSLEGRAGPHTFDVSIPASGIRQIRVSSTFVPKSGSDAQTNALAWVAAVEARTASNLTWLPTADQAPIIDGGLSGQGDFDSKTLGSQEAFVVIQVLAQDLIGLSAAARVISAVLTLNPRERAMRVGQADTDPGYDFVFTASIEYRVQDNLTTAYPAAATVAADFKVLFDASVAKVRGGPTAGALTRKVDRTIEGSGGTISYQASGVLAGNQAEAKIISINESVKRSRPGNVNVVTDHLAREVIYVGPELPAVIVHTLEIVQADGYATYSSPNYFEGSYFLEGDVETEPLAPFPAPPVSDAMGVDPMGTLYPIRFMAVYRERGKGSRTSLNGVVS